MKRSTVFGLFFLISAVVSAEEINLSMKFSEILPSEKNHQELRLYINDKYGSQCLNNYDQLIFPVIQWVKGCIPKYVQNISSKKDREKVTEFCNFTAEYFLNELEKSGMLK